MPVKINWERAETVFGKVLEDLRLGKPPHDRIQVPQLRENLSDKLKWGSVEHACFLFCVCYYMRGGIESHTVFQNFRKLFDRHRELFDPSTFGRITTPEAEEITVILVRNGLGFNSYQVGQHWIYNFRKLYLFWESDPANLFRGVQSYEDACRVLMRGGRGKPISHGFYGFREKMVSMLIYFLQHAGIIPLFNFPVPVDFHVLRVLVANGVIDNPDIPYDESIYRPELLAAARMVTAGYCSRFAVNPLQLADALWLRSLGLCKLTPGNFRNIGERNGRKTPIYEAPILWTRSETITYLNTCGVCSLESTCRSNIPSAPYYVQGKLFRTEKREKPNLLF